VTRPPGMSISPPTLFSALGLLGLLGVMGGCAWLPGRAPSEAQVDPSQARFTAGLHAAEASDFQGARELLEELVTHCESGPWGRDAVLVMGALELSPRNPAGTPDVAAGLLARYLQEPTAPPSSVILAETLYLAALDRGADPVGNPFVFRPDLPPVAPRFAACHRDSDPAPVRSLPTLPESGATREILDRTQVERDSLAILADSLIRRNEALEAELDRIRRLLLPDTVRSGGTPSLSRP
jgi:hypothetical protein